jgi:type IV secretory pathway TraG/TraD family ATPase VirD4
MTPTKLLIGQILVVFAIMVLGVWAATQWAAAMLAYQPELGSPWFELRGLPFYRPWALFCWWFQFEAYAPTVFNKAGALAGASGFLGCGAAVSGSLWRARQPRSVTTYGSAHWAAAKDLRAAGLLGNSGVFLGAFAGTDLRHDGLEHVLAFAPTRSGKGVGLVVPTLLSWTGSAVVHDIKGENWSLTAGWRSLFSHCLLFNPTDPKSARYNPLLEVRRGADEVRDVQNIADILVDPEGALERRNHWEKTAHALLVGVILHMVAYGQRRALLVWTRIVFPNGASIELDNLPATDAAGYAGLEDRVDSHSWQLLKGIALSTLLGVSAQLSIGGGGDLVRAIRESTQQNAAHAGDKITSRNLDIQPTIKVRPGWPVRVLVSKDLVFQPWRA